MPNLSDDEISGLSEMDAPDNMPTLHALGTRDGLRSVHAEDFPTAFDLS
jgi:hypothetical protein